MHVHAWNIVPHQANKNSRLKCAAKRNQLFLLYFKRFITLFIDKPHETSLIQASCLRMARY